MSQQESLSGPASGPHPQQQSSGSKSADEWKAERELKLQKARIQAQKFLKPIWERTPWEQFSIDEIKAIKQVEERLSTGYITIYPETSEYPITVVHQEKCRTFRAVIPTVLADIPCSKFTADQLLLCLDSLLYTTRSKSPGEALVAALKSYIDDEDIDFGTAYAYLRGLWQMAKNDSDFTNFRARLAEQQTRFDTCRESLLKDNIITSNKVPPRRLWDVYSNRVVSAVAATLSFDDVHAKCVFGQHSHCKMERWWAISHSWVNEAARTRIRSRVNANQWEIPLPCDTSLERVRIEVFNLLAELTSEKQGEYAWLDLLCLRQYDKDAEGEKWRTAEWTIDVPTIGHIYRLEGGRQWTVIYFCGLGRPLVYGNENEERHWLNRAWTLQEMARGFAKTGGLTKGMPDPIARDAKETTFIKRFRQLDFYHPVAEPLGPILEMRNRFSTHEVDLIGGLLYPLQAQRVYAYRSDEPIEDAWRRLLSVLPSLAIICLATSFPSAGSHKGPSLLLPTWGQISQLHEDFAPPRPNIYPFGTYRKALICSQVEREPPLDSLNVAKVDSRRKNKPPGRLQYSGRFDFVRECNLVVDVDGVGVGDPLFHEYETQAGVDLRGGSIYRARTLTFHTEIGELAKTVVIVPQSTPAGSYSLVVFSHPPEFRTNTSMVAALIGHWDPLLNSFSKVAGARLPSPGGSYDRKTGFGNLPITEENITFL